jgi:type VI secretion system protein ImpA
MPLRNDLLNPIPGENPAGENLRYAPVIDKIKEARRQDDDAPQGEWARERKVADWSLTAKLTQDTLATKSKDLQLVAWLSEAVLRREGIGTFKDVIDFARNLLEQFWDGLYPELEDGDAELRATPLQWIGDRLEMPVKQLPLTRKGLNWFQYKESRAVGSEAAADTSEKQEAREKQIKAGKITLEVFDKEFEETPKKFYVDQLAIYDGTLKSLTGLGGTCDEKFGGAAPSFGTLQSALEEVRNTIHVLLQKKRETEPDEPEPEAELTPEAAAVDAGEPAAGDAADASARGARPSGALFVQPADASDAVRSLLAVAAYLRAQDEFTPAPYLMTSGFRWGELRAKGESIDPRMLAAPPTEVRQKLKSLALDGAWKQVLKEAQSVAALEYGRGWLDVHRYIARACSSLGAQGEPIRLAVISGVRGLLAYYPSLPGMTLMDDTATANAETLIWLRDEVLPPPPDETDDGAAQAVAFDQALEAAKTGRPEVAIQILMRELGQERTGRGRFLRKAQAARICMSAGHEAIAHLILQDLAAEIENRKLEEWEAPELVAQALALFVQCLGPDKEGEKQRLYESICRLDPRTALTVQR